MNRARPAWLALAVLVALAWLAYWPGRNGGYVFDDFSNLAPLGEFGRIDRWWKAVAFVTSGFAGPTGRPLALASFLLDARDWPAPPLAFKLTNVAIHLGNGVLLSILLAALSRALGEARRPAAWIGVLAGGLWMLDPAWVSTTLYVVQRMALLATTFVLAGLCGYIHGRMLLARGRARAGYAWMTGALLAGTITATLSKENGALLPLLALVLEWQVLSGRVATARGFVAWRWTFLVLPSLLLLAYLASWFSGTASALRLLTEARVEWHYLARVWIPIGDVGAPFHDDVRASTGWLEPRTTLPAVCGVLVLASATLWLRRARSTVAASAGAAFSFFLAAQLLESTWIPLQAEFDHRAYLAAALMFWAPAAWLVGLAGRRAGAPRSWPRWLAAAVLALFALQTARTAWVWGRPFEQALVWAARHPASPEALSYLADFWLDTGNDAEAVRLIDAAQRLRGDDLVVLIHRADLACVAGEAAPDLRAALLTAAGSGGLGDSVARLRFDALLDGPARCAAFGPGFDAELVAAALRAALPGDVWTRRDLLHRQALAALAQGDAAAAMRFDHAALDLSPEPPGMRLRMAADFGQAHRPDLGLMLLGSSAAVAPARGWSMAAIHQRWVLRSGFYADSEAHLRAVLRAELAGRDQRRVTVRRISLPSGE